MILICLIAVTATVSDKLSGVGNPGADIVVAQTLRNHATNFGIIGGAAGGITISNARSEAWNLETILDAAVVTIYENR